MSTVKLQADAGQVVDQSECPWYPNPSPPFLLLLSSEVAPAGRASGSHKIADTRNYRTVVVGQRQHCFGQRKQQGGDSRNGLVGRRQRSSDSRMGLVREGSRAATAGSGSRGESEQGRDTCGL